MKKNMPKQISSQSKRRGFTLTEIAIVLGIMGLILGAIWVAASSVYTNMRVSTTTRDVIQMSQQIRQLYANQGSIDNGLATPATARAAGVIPSDMDNNSAAAGILGIDAWGGNVTFTGNLNCVGTADCFVISLANIPTAGCAGLLTDASVKTSGGGVYGINAGAAVFTTSAGVGTTVNWTPTAAAAAAACAAAANVNVGYAFTIH